MASGSQQASSFRKKAEPSLIPAPPSNTASAHARRPTAGGKALAAAERESDALEKFDERWIYIEPKALNVPLDIDSLVVVDGKFDEDRFRTLTRPGKAATGLRYVRLVEMYIAWYNDQIDDPTVKSAPPTSKENCWKFLHSLVEHAKSAIYACEFFSEGLGFDNKACSWVRCRRLGSAHAVATKPAAALPTPLLSYLEEAVLDENSRVDSGFACKPVFGGMTWSGHPQVHLSG